MIRLLLLSVLLLGSVARAEDAAPRDWDATTEEIVRLAVQGERESAVRAAEAAMQRARAEFGADDPRTADILSLMAELRMVMGDWVEAERLLLEGMAIRDRVLPPLHWARDESRNLLGAVYANTGRLDEAERSHRWAAEQATRAAEAGLAGPNAPRWIDVPAALDMLAGSWHKHGRQAGLPALHAEILGAIERWGGSDAAIAMQLLDRHSTEFEHRDDRANALRAVASMLDLAAATGDQAMQAEARFRQGRLADSADDHAAAAGHFLAAWALADRALHADDPARVTYIVRAAKVALEQGDTPDVERWLRGALEIARVQSGQVDALEHAQALAMLADLLEDGGRHAEAVALRRDVVPLYSGIYGETSWMVASALSDLAGALATTAELEPARTAYRDAFDALRRSGDEEGWLDAHILHRWIEVELRVGDLRSAAERWTALLALRDRAGEGGTVRAAQARRELAALHRAAGLGEPQPAAAAEATGLQLRDAYRMDSLLDLLTRAEDKASAQPDSGTTGRLMLAAELAFDDGSVERAAQGYDKALSILLRGQGPVHPLTRAVAQRLEALHREAGREDLAALVQARLARPGD